MKEFVGNRTELLTQFNTDSSVGLTTGQAGRNQEKYGKNMLTKEKPKSLAKRIFEGAVEPMIFMLILAGIVDIAVNVIRAATGGKADFLECAGIFVAIFLDIACSNHI
jgi:Cation transport ATPase